MSTTREFDLGDGGGCGGGEPEDHKAKVRKVENTRLGSGVGMSRMASDHQHQCFQGSRNGTSPRPGVGRPPWLEDHAGSNLPMKKEEQATTWDRPAPTNRSHEDSALLRKAAVMYGSRRATAGAHLQASSAGTSFLPFYDRKMVARRFEGPHPQQHQHQHQHQQHPNVGAPAGTKQPGTAQLTIFYAGMVNVYDDVPFDKAQAIMLLAGTGNAWQASSNYNMVGGANRGSRPFATPSGGTNQQPMSRAFFPAPQPSTPASSAGAPATPPDRPVPAAVELPQARKASLARFLEKRKDRVRKAPNEEAAKSDAMRSDSRENSPSNITAPESSGKPALSPSSTRKESNNGNETYGNESTSSHPPTPPRPSTASDPGKLQQFDISARTERPVLSPSR